MTVNYKTDASAVSDYNAAFFETEGRKRLAQVITFGCKMNENDAEKIAGLLCEMGFDIESPPARGRHGNPAPLGAIGAANNVGDAKNVGDANDVGVVLGGVRLPELIILNTCCVRGNAEQRFFGILGSLKRYKADDPSRVLAVCGCMMQEEKAVASIRDKYGYVDFIFGTKSISMLPALLAGAYRERSIPAHTDKRKYQIPVANALSDGAPDDHIPMRRKAPPLALVSIMSGCDNFCAYCVVPYVRGRERSRTPESIVAEAERLASEGYRELMLLGQNVNSYGGGLSGGRVDFPDLLERLSDISGICRIRFMTSHPKDLSDRLIRAIRELDPVCPQLHLPVQSGSSAVLERMNRGYSRVQYMLLAGKLRDAVPEIALSTDFIVGFPGESERDFDDTLSLAEELRFDLAYTFLFSPREGTAAAEFTDRVPDAVAKERFDRLLALQNGISAEKNRALEGSVQQVLCEGASKTGGDRYTGKTPGGKTVNFLPDARERSLTSDSSYALGKLYDVRIETAKTWSLDGIAI